MVHVTAETGPTSIGNRVTVGHSAIVHACTIEDNVLIGMGAIILDNAVIGEGSIVGAGALVTSAVGAALSALPEVLLLLGIMLGLAVAALAVAALTWRVEKAGGV